jgi:hypothetical protein
MVEWYDTANSIGENPMVLINLSVLSRFISPSEALSVGRMNNLAENDCSNIHIQVIFKLFCYKKFVIDFGAGG